MGNENGVWILHGVSRDDPRCVKTPEELTGLVERMGFLPLFQNEVPGFSAEEHTCAEDWWTGDTSRDPWEWRELLARSERVAYGKFFHNKAGFLSLAWLPHFVNFRREGYDFDALWEDGKAHYRTKKIMDSLPLGERRFSFELKTLGGFGPGGEPNFEGALTALQMRLYLVMADFRQRQNRRGEPYGWPIAVYAAPETLWGYESVTAAYKDAPAESRRRILARAEELFPSAEAKAILTVLT